MSVSSAYGAWHLPPIGYHVVVFRPPDPLPIGLQIIAPWLEEQRIFAVAASFEQAFGSIGQPA